MSPKFWLVLEWSHEAMIYKTVEEFSDKDELNLHINGLNTEGLMSLEVISGFSLVKRVQ